VTAHRSLEAAGVAYTPIHYDWRWNERHYGALQGLSKERTAVRLGRETVMKWRRSYEAQPPLMTIQHPHFHTIQNDARYQHLAKQQHMVPRGESLQDCQERVVKAWKDVCQELGNDSTTIDDEDHSLSDYSLLVAHANTLRALVMHLDEIDVEDIQGLNIPTAIPFYYDIDKTTGQVVGEEESIGGFRGLYITDERKQRSFLERRRAANDPWLWALHDHQVATSLLNGTTTTTTSSSINGNAMNGNTTQNVDADCEEVVVEGLQGSEDEGRMKNTELYSPGQTASSQIQ
jgi:bisphosphoglycerate-dependent phosphoglycerate mutase family 1